MLILVFDTCLDKMYVTLAEDDKILSSKIVTNKDNKYHSAFLISTIKEVLKENSLTPKDLSAIGTNVGPGSFTGIRACTTVARMMAQQLNLPAVGVSSLDVLSKISSSEKSVVVALDARKNSAYLYMDNDIKSEAVSLEKVQELLSAGDYELITDDKLQPVLGGISYQQKEYPLGDILSQIVFNKLQNEKPDWRKLKPLYIQPPPQL
ncbi:MAG: tRNA (adenosine(37)-N6)-threonylcarbamoyltransferase complex dimerization subunit type 1 TsaB [Candidatus Gastranaerophilaceae bacterium]